MGIVSRIKEEIAIIKARDPAMHSDWEVLLYPSFRAIMNYRVSHKLYAKGHYFLARYLSQRSARRTGIEIHPGATIGRGLFIDHGHGVVIGETAIVGDNVTLYQGVTLGGTGKESGKRHPTIGDNVVVSSGAKILGSFTVGANSKIGSGSVVLHEVPPNSVVVGIPGRVVALDGVRVKDNDPESAIDLDHDILPDPVADYEEKLAKHMEEINKRLKELEKSIYTNCCQAKDKD